MYILYVHIFVVNPQIYFRVVKPPKSELNGREGIAGKATNIVKHSVQKMCGI